MIRESLQRQEKKSILVVDYSLAQLVQYLSHSLSLFLSILTDILYSIVVYLLVYYYIRMLYAYMYWKKDRETFARMHTFVIRTIAKNWLHLGVGFVR